MEKRWKKKEKEEKKEKEGERKKKKETKHLSQKKAKKTSKKKPAKNEKQVKTYSLFSLVSALKPGGTAPVSLLLASSLVSHNTHTEETDERE